MNPQRRRRDPDYDTVVRSIIDDDTVERLRQAARQRSVSLDTLIGLLLHAASTRVDELLEADEA